MHIMSQAVRRMTLEEFAEWQSHQDVRCELVEGQVFAMTGATFAHDIVVGNLSFSLARQLRDTNSKCRPFTADIGLVTGRATLRRPDVAVYCPPFNLGATSSSDPTLVADVLSPSTERVDQVAKLLEYRALPTLRTILLLAPDQIDIGVWRRVDGVEWRYDHILDDSSGMIEIPDLGLTIPVHELYVGAALQPITRPRLVWPDTKGHPARTHARTLTLPRPGDRFGA